VKNERKCRDAEAEMKNARGRKTEMLPTAIRMLNSTAAAATTITTIAITTSR